MSEREEWLKLTEKLAELRREAEELETLRQDVTAARQLRQMIVKTRFD